MMALLSYEEALARLLDSARPLPSIRTALLEALGQVLASDICSPVDLPPFANSSMDGVALRAQDLTDGLTLPLAGEISAGSVPSTLPPGTCVEIFTGAPLPRGADSVVPVEKVERANGTVRFEAPPAPGEFIRLAGSDVSQGAQVVTAGQLLTPAAIAALAATGVHEVEVVSRARIGIVVTGNELANPAAELRPGQIYDANGPSLAAMAHRAGAVVQSIDHCRDERASLDEVLGRRLGECDLIVISGGVSVGRYDLVKEAAIGLGADPLFAGVALKPGRPTAAFTLGSCTVVALAGNPASCLVGWALFVAPLLDRLHGATTTQRWARLAAAVLREGRTRGIRCVSHHDQDGGRVVTPLSSQLSHQIAASSMADSVALIDPGKGRAEAGSVVPWRPL